MELLIVLAAGSLVAFLLSTLWLNTVGVRRPALLYGNPVGRFLVVLGAAPFFFTVGLTSLFALPLVALVVAIAEGWQESEREVFETWKLVKDVWAWFTLWAPTFVVTGVE